MSANIKRLKSNFGALKQRAAAVAGMPDLGPQSKHPFDVARAAVYKAVQLHLRTKALSPLPKGTRTIPLPLPVVKPPVTS